MNNQEQKQYANLKVSSRNKDVKTDMGDVGSKIIQEKIDWTIEYVQ